MESSLHVNAVRLIQGMELGRQGLKKLREKRDRMNGPARQPEEEVKGAGDKIRKGVARALAEMGREEAER